MGKLDDLLSAVSRSAPESQYIRAYHGSPYDFDRFDASKIGTGEGHQVYGRGLYFAGSEDVADTYRKSVSALQRTPQEDAMEFWRRHVERTDNPRNAVQYAIDDAEESMQEAAGIPQAEQRWREIIQHLYELDYRQPIPKRPGHMYEVEIGVPEDRLLDYDAMLPGQSPYVRERLARMDYTAPHIMRPARRAGTGSAVVDALRNSYQTTQDQGMALLRDAGIPGVRYFDQLSRDVGAGTRNYVMFPGTEDSIRILRKYGLLAPIAAGAAMEGGDE
jgi:hypothetical protein